MTVADPSATISVGDKVMLESPRWHEDVLWGITGTVRSLLPKGKCAVLFEINYSTIVHLHVHTLIKICKH